MPGYYGNIEEETLENDNFRKVLFTGANLQLVVMSLGVTEDIGAEVHHDVDQFFRFEAGVGKVIVGGDEYEVKDGDAVVVPAGVEHNVINTSEDVALKLYTIYSPPNHPDGTVHKNKQEAIEYEAEHHGHGVEEEFDELADGE